MIERNTRNERQRGKKWNRQITAFWISKPLDERRRPVIRRHGNLPRSVCSRVPTYSTSATVMRVIIHTCQCELTSVSYMPSYYQVLFHISSPSSLSFYQSIYLPISLGLSLCLFDYRKKRIEITSTWVGTRRGIVGFSQCKASAGSLRTTLKARETLCVAKRRNGIVYFFPSHFILAAMTTQCNRCFQNTNETVRTRSSTILTLSRCSKLSAEKLYLYIMKFNDEKIAISFVLSRFEI